jgi:pentatricopeptide repeat protein
MYTIDKPVNSFFQPSSKVHSNVSTGFFFSCTCLHNNERNQKKIHTKNSLAAATIYKACLDGVLKARCFENAVEVYQRMKKERCRTNTETTLTINASFFLGQVISSVCQCHSETPVYRSLIFFWLHRKWRCQGRFTDYTLMAGVGDHGVRTTDRARTARSSDDVCDEGLRGVRVGWLRPAQLGWRWSGGRRG